MSSKWKTSQRRSRKIGNSESTGSSYGDPAASDGSSMSFLDDMLATGERSNRSGSNSNNNNASSRVTPPGGSGGGIDDILDLMGTSQHSGSRRGGSNSSNLSGLSQRKGTNSNPGSAPTSPYAPSPRSGNNSPYVPRSANRTVQRYGGAGGGGTGAGAGNNNIASRGSRGSREYSRDDPPSSRQEQSHFRSDEHRQSAANQEVMTPDYDNITPIPIFSVNAAGREDDDSISCITTSVTSHYEVDSSRSGSFPWSSRGRKSATSQGETSYADTLDEIADLLHPNPNSNAGRGNNSNTPRNIGHNNNNDLRRSTSAPVDDFFRPPAKVDEIFGSTTKHVSKSGGSPPLSADEIYRSSKNSKRNNTSAISMLSYCEPFLSQTRLLIRYWISLIVPRSWRKKEDKDDDGQGHLGTWSSPSTKIPRSKQQSQLWRSVCCSVSGWFFVLTVTILLVRLAIMHGPFTWQPAVARIRGGIKDRRNKKNKVPVPDLAGKNVHGGMAKRRDDGDIGSGGGGGGGDSRDTVIVAGGMSKHRYNVDEAQEEESLDQIQVYGGHKEHVGIELPEAFDNLADITELPVRKGVDIPLFWHIPRTGGGTVNDIFGGCLGLTLAADAGASGAAGKENKLEVVKFSKHFSYVNVDIATADGIERARRLDLASSGLADVIVSTLLYQAASLFSSQHKGRLFTIVRHPVERAVSLFHYVQDTQWRRRQTFKKELSELTIAEYFESGLAENNWMTRFLINEPTKGELTKADVNLAKEILRKKCLIGLLSDKGESFARFERFFGFPIKDDEQKECHEKKLQWSWPLKHRHDEVEENTPLWDLILTQNVYDMELYHYASEVLFIEQAKIFL